MAHLHPSSLHPLALCLCSLVAATAAGQPKNNPNREQLEATGAIQAMRPGLIQMVTDDGVNWLLKVEGKSLAYYAEAEPAWLKPGMVVQFSGQFDSKGTPQSAIRLLKVVTPSADLPLGVSVDAAANAAKGLFSDAPKEPQKQLISADVVGRIAAVKNNTLAVVTPQAKIKIEVAEKAVVSVELNNLQLAKIGDSIEANGWYPKGLQGRAIASRVTVRAKEPLKAWKKPVRTAPKGKDQPITADNPLNGPQ